MCMCVYLLCTVCVYLLVKVQNFTQTMLAQISCGYLSELQHRERDMYFYLAVPPFDCVERPPIYICT